MQAIWMVKANLRHVHPYPQNICRGRIVIDSGEATHLAIDDISARVVDGWVVYDLPEEASLSAIRKGGSSVLRQ